MQFFQSTRALHENEWEYVETVTDASCQFEYYICVSQAQLRFFSISVRWKHEPEILAHPIQYQRMTLTYNQMIEMEVFTLVPYVYVIYLSLINVTF